MNRKLDQLGWVVSAAFAGIILAGGFQSPTDKIGVVDIAEVVETSTFGEANQADFAKMKGARESLLEFIDANRVVTNEQAQRLRDLILKETPTEPEKAEIEKIKGDIIASHKRWKDLEAKPDPTAEDRTLLDEYARRSQTMNQVAQRWYGEFTNDMQDWADKRKVDSVKRARAAIQEVAKSQGFTIVFEVGIAPYGANELTAAAVQAMNAQK